MVGPAARSSRQRPCGQIALADPDRGVAVDQRAALLDVQLDEGADPAQRPRRPGRARRGRRRRARIASAIVVPSASVSAAGPVGVERAGEQPGAGAGDAEPGALLVGEAGDADRPAGSAAARPSRSSAAKADDDAERPVERAAVGHRVEVAADDEARAAGVGIRRPRPQVAGPVGHDVQPAGRRLAANHSRSDGVPRVQAKRR